MPKYLAGSDVGTGGTKSVVIDLEGNVLGSHFIEYPLITPRPGWAEHKPEWYWRAVADTLRVSIEQSKVDPKDILGVGISALSPACILVDKDLRPLQDGHIWMDRRATAECQWLRENIGEERVFKLSGNPIDPYYATAKLMWEKNNRPDLYKRTYKLQTAADYPAMRLCGKAVTDYSNASLIGIAFDIVNKKWDEEMIREIGLDIDKFPDLYAVDDVIGYVTKEAALETGLAAGTPVIAGTVDCNAAWASMGVIDDGDASLVMGTAGVLGIVHTEPNFTKDMITIVHTADSKAKYTTVAALVSCGALVRYFRDNFGALEMDAARKLGISEYDIQNLEAAKAPLGSDGLITLPYFMGERTPIWDPIARGVLFGLSLAHGRGHMVRSFMEAVGYGILHNLEPIRENVKNIKNPLFLGEGGANSRFWRGIIADILDVPVAFMESSKGAPVGDALAAGVAVGEFKDYSVAKKWMRVTDAIEPDERRHQEYMKYYRIYRDLYPALRPLYEELAEATGYK